MCTVITTTTLTIEVKHTIESCAVSVFLAVICAAHRPSNRALEGGSAGEVGGRGNFAHLRRCSALSDGDLLVFHCRMAVRAPSKAASMNDNALVGNAQLQAALHNEQRTNAFLRKELRECLAYHQVVAHLDPR